MKLSEFDYELPRELIAQYPLMKRDMCRLMVLDRKKEKIEHRAFRDIAGYFHPGDLLILNDTKVIPARLFGYRPSGGRIEIFLLEKKDGMCEALIRPSARVRTGEKLVLESGDEVLVLGPGKIGRFVQFQKPLDEILRRVGHMPIPPYIDRTDDEVDKVSYQTVYGVKEGATASPTAGLHFTLDLLKDVKSRGAEVRFLTLHTSYGTFAPIKTDDVESHKMQEEYFDLPGGTAEAIRQTRKNGGKIFAVGTTTTRVLEHCAAQLANSQLSTMSHEQGYTDFYIHPGYNFKIVDNLITNFHFSKSTLLVLVSAFAGREFVLRAYKEAIVKKYQFFSYGDAMLIL